MNLIEYRDKEGTVINGGDTLIHDDGTTEFVYICSENEKGFHDLGFNASNEAWLSRTNKPREIYPLYQFDLREWKVLKR